MMQPTQPQPENPNKTEFIPLVPADIDEILLIEQSTYSHPWTRGHFLDSIQAGYFASGIQRCDSDKKLIAYAIAMVAVDELQILNLTVSPAFQGQGHGYAMLKHLGEFCRTARLRSIWLEVRAGNKVAQSLYEKFGFLMVGTRPRYYPSIQGQREDATLMRMDLHTPIQTIKLSL